MSSPPWQDRRFMFKTGKEVHEPSRKTSISGSKAGDAPKIAIPGGLATLTAASSAGGESASRFLFKTGKEVHEPSRKTSVSGTKATDAPKIATSPTEPTSTSTTASSAGSRSQASGKRRSSASSQGTMFGGLLANRSSDEHAQRRQTRDEMKRPEGLGGFFSGFVNKPTEKK